MPRTGPLTKDTSTIALGLAQIRVGNSADNVATQTDKDVNPTGVLTSAQSIGALANTKFTSNVDYWKLESGFPALEDLSIPLRESVMMECAFKEVTPFNLALARGIDPAAAVTASVVIVGPGDNNTGTTNGTTGTITPDATGTIADEWTVIFMSATTIEIVGKETGYLPAGPFDVTAGPIEPDNGGNPYFSIPDEYFDNGAGEWATDDTYVFRTYPAIADGGYSSAHAGHIALGGLTSPAYVRMEALYTFPNGTNTMLIVFPRCNVTSSVEIDLQAEDNANVPIVFEAKRADSEVSGGNAEWDDAPLGRIIFA